MPPQRAVAGRTRRGRRVSAVTAATLLAAATTAWVSDVRVGAQGEPPLDPAAFSATVDNPLFPISKLRFTRSRGVERTESGRRIALRVEIRVLPRKTRVAGVPVTVVEDNDFENGRLVEHTFDYFAQDRDGNVWYFGERIDEYERGRLVGHEGQWLAGKRGAKPGLFMPAAPKVGAAFAQENAPRRGRGPDDCAGRWPSGPDPRAGLQGVHQGAGLLPAGPGDRVQVLLPGRRHRRGRWSPARGLTS